MGEKWPKKSGGKLTQKLPGAGTLQRRRDEREQHAGLVRGRRRREVELLRVVLVPERLHRAHLADLLLRHLTLERTAPSE